MITKEQIQNIGKDAKQLDNTLIIASGIEYYSTGINRHKEWTIRDLFVLSSLCIPYEVLTHSVGC